MNFWRKLLETGLESDGAHWDWTARGLRGQARAEITARDDLVWVGNELLGQLGVSANLLCADGDRISRGTRIAMLTGEAKELLGLERSVLNLVSYASGIATETREMVDLLESRPIRLTLTRKILPGYQDLAATSVMVGGGYVHRLGLSSGILVKENHIFAAGGLTRAVENVRATAPHGFKVEVEVTNEKELLEALEARAEIVMLDNFSPASLKDALAILSQSQFKPLVEVSGGITKTNLLEYAQEGVDIISVGALTHSVKSANLSLRFIK